MSEREIAAAVAEQEEHIKRSTSCGGRVGRAHAFRPHGTPSKDRTIAGARLYSACIVCGVTETMQDFATRRGARDE